MSNRSVQDADVQEARDLLTDYFESEDPIRFRFEKIIGVGAYGIAWRLKYKPSTPSGGSGKSRRVVMKMDRSHATSGLGEQGGDEGDESRPTISHESHYLSILKWAKHVVNLIEPPNDPLKQQIPDIPPHGIKEGEWMYLEWLENGTLSSFLDRAIEANRQLPNRMMWRFFLCLTRMGIAMAWPPDGPGDDGGPQLETIGQRRARRMVHDDLHDENVMFGDFDEEDGEHDLTPVMKAIDFGLAKIYGDHPRYRGMGMLDNIFSFGILMSEIATLDRSNAGIGEPTHEDADLYAEGREEEILIAATVLIPDEEPNTSIDPDLRYLIASCTQIRKEDRPSLQDLERQITEAIETRDEQWYVSRNMNARGESDENIDDIIQELILDA
ncbi:kinase-like domain-containing protein [Daldinia vernicosa]|uniref:kinase-like domain-containing protein n=1 Tax=Daldinia vernicosa TaxID=114800 RepID=UPI002008E847|nr:kinase-like domain-containing protein [Daldinia vernicosa]KAI0853045.1 kinase-like domain-containing protein [Daldinia vernicosa]